MHVIMQDQSLSELWIHDKLERQASHSLFRALVTQMEKTFDRPCVRGLPTDVRIQPLDSLDETRVQLQAGTSVIVKVRVCRANPPR